ncbi:major facilitator superfamily domain-containing protein [Xylariales sp. PMI_506]|nr:major facilitator superfamily domain-containing protein [Xylariales sp. PMI_506]
MAELLLQHGGWTTEDEAIQRSINVNHDAHWYRYEILLEILAMASTLHGYKYGAEISYRSQTGKAKNQKGPTQWTNRPLGHYQHNHMTSPTCACFTQIPVSVDRSARLQLFTISNEVSDGPIVLPSMSPGDDTQPYLRHAGLSTSIPPLIVDGAHSTESGTISSSEPTESDCLLPGVNTRVDTIDVQDHLLKFKVASAMFGFLVQGLFVSGIGAIISKLEESYSLTDTKVSLIFLSTPIGYLISACANDFIHARLGQRGIAIIGPSAQIIYGLAASLRPPFYVFLAFATFGGFGTGLVECAWCAWSGGMQKNANMIQGFLHASYSVGASLGPVMVGTMISVAHIDWNVWYGVLSLCALFELITSAIAFRHENSAQYHSHNCQAHAERVDNTRDMDGPTILSSLFRQPAFWISGLFFLIYVGIESSITGWIVVYMIRARHSSLILASLCSSLFNIGMVAGRLTLGALTDRLGLRVAVNLYLLVAVVFQIAFIIIEIPVADAAIITVIGVALGPMFPSGITMLVSFLPKSMHVMAVAAIGMLGQIGGSVMPFTQGFVADRAGIGSYQYIILGQLIAVLLVWRCFPKSPASTDAK